MSAEPVAVDEGTKETVRELVRMCNNLQSDVEDLQETVEDQQETIDDLETQNNAYEAQLDAYQTKMNRIEDIIVGEERDFGEDEFDVADDIWTQIEDAREMSENALAISKSSSKRDDNTTKKEVAKTLTRDDTVVTSIRTSQKASAVDCEDVITMAKPDTRLAHRTILDAWSELEDEWDAFETIKKETPDGQTRKMLRCYTENLNGVLVRNVKNNLSDPEATETLNSWIASEGVR